LGKWGGRNKYHQLCANFGICSGGGIKPGIRIINELFIINSAAVIMGRNNPPHLPKAVNRYLQRDHIFRSDCLYSKFTLCKGCDERVLFLNKRSLVPCSVFRFKQGKFPNADAQPVTSGFGQMGRTQ